jgi:ComF family protein
VSVLPGAAGLVLGFRNLVFPPACAACRGAIPASDPDRLVCRGCWSRVREAPHPRCRRCAAPLPTGAPEAATCPECRELPSAIRAVRSAALLQGAAQSVVHALKYGRWAAVAEEMAARMAAVEFPRDVVEEIRWLVPVPVSTLRRRERGFNQAHLLAAGVGRRWQREVRPDLLVRTRDTGSQTALHPGERRANVARAFAVPAEREGMLRGEHVLLVDDVWTTGATASAAAGTLLAGGARAVSVLTFARAVPDV